VEPRAAQEGGFVAGVPSKDVASAGAYGTSEDDRNKARNLLFKNFKKACELRQQFERDWFLSILFYSGNQWLDWSRSRKQYVSKRAPSGITLPVTNIFAEKIDDNVASLVKQPPNKTWSPETDDPDDIATAEIADRVDEVIAEESRRKAMMRGFATWAVLCGTSFIENWYDNNEEHGFVSVALEQCQNCGAYGNPATFKRDGPMNPGQCPECGHGKHKPAFEVIGASCPQCGYMSQDPEDAFNECPQCLMASITGQQIPLDLATAQEGLNPLEQDPTLSEPPVEIDPSPGTQRIGNMAPIYDERQPVMEEYPRGRIMMKVRSPFEVFVDHAKVMEATPDGGMRWYITVDLIDRDEAKEKYGYTPGDADKSSSASSSGGTSEMYRQSLALLSTDLGVTASSIDLGSGGRGVSAGSSSDTVVMHTMHMLPTKDYPEGLRVAVLGGKSGKVVELDPLPNTDSKGKPFLPLVAYRFKEQPGRFWGKGLAVDLVPLQKQRNLTEALMIMIERRMAMPNWLIPLGIMKTLPAGEPGEILEYKSLGDGTQGRNSVPQKLDGVPPSNYFMSRLESLDMKMEQLSGSFGIAGGEPPKGVTAASAIAILVERQQHQISPQVESWESAIEAVARQQMDIFRKWAVDERIRSIRGRNSVWKTERWSSADLSGNVNVKVEPGSALPKSGAADRANAEAIVKLGAVDPSDPKVRYNLLERFGETNLVSHQQVDEVSAERENDKFFRLATGQHGGDLPDFNFEIDNHAVHLEKHLEFAKSDDFSLIRKRGNAGDDEAFALHATFMQHITEHKQAILQEQMAMAEAAGASQQPNGQQGDWQPGPGRPKGTGNVLSRGARAQSEEGTRAVLEPPNQ